MRLMEQAQWIWNTSHRKLTKIQRFGIRIGLSETDVTDKNASLNILKADVFKIRLQQPFGL